MKINYLYMFSQDSDAHLITYIRDNPPEMNNDPRPALLICPGGGYQWTSDRESEPVALQFLARGYNVFVLKYSVAQMASELRPLHEAALAIKHIRENAIEYNIDPSRVYIMGFSAGGHLACSLGVYWNNSIVKAALGDGVDAQICRPDAMVLCYPVVTATCPTHLGTLHNFCGTEAPNEELLNLFSLDIHVDKDTSPAFIWHTESDASVPVQNSRNLAHALEENAIKHELVLFPEGYHGLSLATHETCHDIPENEPHPASVWVELADKWLKNL
jgi:acetyl esterase/lipase